MVAPNGTIDISQLVWLARGVARGVVHHGIEPPGGRQGQLYRARHCVTVGHIASRPRRIVAPRGDFLGDGQPRLGPGGDDDVRPRRGESHRDATTNAGARTRHQRGETVQAHGSITAPPSATIVSPTR